MDIKQGIQDVLYLIITGILPLLITYGILFLKVKIKNGGTLRNGVNFEKNNGPEVIPAELWIDEIEAY